MKGHKESAQTAVKRLLSELNGVLRPFDFRRRGQTFARQSNECWQVINVQLSRFSDRGEKRFTVNFGVQSKAVLQFRGTDRSIPPLYYTCPINFRIGWFMQRNDVWWTVRDDVSARLALGDIDDVLRGKALPFLSQLQTDRSILEFYEMGEILGFEIERDETRLILLAKIGANNEVQKRLEEYRARWPKTVGMKRALQFLENFESVNH